MPTGLNGGHALVVALGLMVRGGSGGVTWSRLLLVSMLAEVFVGLFLPTVMRRRRSEVAPQS